LYKSISSRGGICVDDRVHILYFIKNLKKCDGNLVPELIVFDAAGYGNGIGKGKNNVFI